MSHSERTQQVEADFLSGMELKFEQAKGQLLRGSTWQLVRQDDSDRLRSLMARHGKFDRRLLADVPKNRRIVLHSYVRPWWWFGRRRVGVGIASVLTPLEWSVTQATPGEDPPPIGAAELLDHLRSLPVDPQVPHIIGVCSPSGFTTEALEAHTELANITVVLVEPGGHGGWQVHSPHDELDPRLLELFDPEETPGKMKRVTEHLRSHSATLLTGGLAVDSVAAQLDLPPELVRQGFEQSAADDPELHLARHDGEWLIFRGAASEKQERFAMSMVDRIRQLFNREGDESQKINELSKKRAAMSQRRDRMYDDIAQLEQREANLLEQGRANKSEVSRRRLAAQIAQLRKDIARHNATANMLNQQINIMSTDIHNLTLIQQGELASLPSTEDLTDNAVRAEEMLENLQADAELVGSLGTGISERLTSDEELAILQEFEDRPAPPVAESQPVAPPAESAAAPPEPQTPEASDEVRGRQEPEAS